MWLNGLALVMFSAFIVFAVLQTVFGWQVRNEELEQAGQAAQGYWHYCLVVLGIVLRQHGSPESKPVTAPHEQTGE